MKVFWTHGYKQTSIRNLIEHTGVNFHGLYGDFRNKRQLFIKSLELYQRSVGAKIARIVEGVTPDVEGINTCLIECHDFLITANGHSGCLMCNTAIEIGSSDDEIKGFVSKNTEKLSNAFLVPLKVMYEHGDIQQKPKSLASYLANVVYSIALLVRSGRDKRYIKDYVNVAMQAIR